MQLGYTILYCLKQLNGERSASSIYHLLKGKRSSQTLQDGNMFNLSFLFGMYNSLKRHDYDKQIQWLLNEQFIIMLHQNTYTLTEKGEEHLYKWKDMCSFPQHLNGLQYGKIGSSLWRRLSLIVQTVSNLQRENKRFIPIQQDAEVTMWVKNFLINLPYSRGELAGKLYRELHHILKEVTPLEAVIFTYRLTGYQRIGYTAEQLGDMTEQDAFRVQLLFLGTLHFCVQTVRDNGECFPLLTEIVSYPNQNENLFSLSTQKTYYLLKSGRTIDEVSVIRKLKIATIEDHVVEIALREPHFSIEKFIKKEKIEQVQRIIEKLQTRKLRVLKQATGESVSYFEIRLVLARMGDGNEA